MGHRPGDRLGPSQAEVGESWGGGGPRPAQPPSAPTLAPAAARVAQLTSFANCSSLRAPAARPGWPPTSGRAPRWWGGGGGGGDSSRLPLSAGGGSRPSPPPARIIIPVTCLPRHPKAGPRFWNTWRGRGGPPPPEGGRRRGEGPRRPPSPPPPAKVSPTLEDPQALLPAAPRPRPAARTQPPAAASLINPGEWGKERRREARSGGGGGREASGARGGEGARRGLSGRPGGWRSAAPTPGAGCGGGRGAARGAEPRAGAQGGSLFCNPSKIASHSPRP